MSQKINLQEASREELVGAVRFLNSRIESMKQQNVLQELQQLRLVKKELDDRVSTLTEQVSLLKQELNDRNCEAKATHEQVIMLTERAASDEAVIRELMQKLEAASHQPPQQQVTPSTPRHPTAEDDAHIISLIETNALYAAVVKKHEEDERRRLAVPVHKASDEAEGRASLQALHSTVRDLRREVDESRRRVAQLEELLNQKEMEASRMVRWIASKNETVLERSNDRRMHENSSTGNLAALSETGSSKNSTEDSQNNPIHQRTIRTQLATLVHSAKTVGDSGSSSLHLEPLPQLRGMTPREKKLAERISLLEAQLKSLEHNKSQNDQALEEVEKYRSEMLLSANQALEERSREIQVLRRQLQEQQNIIAGSAGQEMAATSLNNVQAEIRELTSVLDAMRSSESLLRAEVADRDSRLAALVREMDEHREKLQSLEAANEELTCRCARIKEEQAAESRCSSAKLVLLQGYADELDLRCAALSELASLWHCRPTDSNANKLQQLSERNASDLQLVNTLLLQIHAPASSEMVMEVVGQSTRARSEYPNNEDVFSMFCSPSSRKVQSQPRPPVEFDPFQ